MNCKTRVLRNLIVSASTLLAVMFLSQGVQAQCVSSELKDKWRAGRYQEVLRPLMACYSRVGRGAEALELKYMLAKTWCNLPLHKQDGCDAYANLKSEGGRYINVNGSSIDLNSDACCRLPEPPSTDSGQPDVGMITSGITMPKPFGDIVNQAQAKMGDETSGAGAVSHAERPSQITSKLSGRCLDILYGSVENTALLVQYDCHVQDNQTWRLVRRDDGYYNIVAKHSGRCLDVNGSSLENGVEIFQYDCHDGDNQRWQVARSDDGYSIINKHSGKCLDVFSGNTENLAHIVQWDCHGGANQKWAIEGRAFGTGTTVGPPRRMRDGSVAPAPGSITVAPPPRRTVVAPPPVRVPPPPL